MGQAGRFRTVVDPGGAFFVFVRSELPPGHAAASQFFQRLLDELLADAGLHGDLANGLHFVGKSLGYGDRRRRE
jgi:hypothetical protein